MHSRGMKGIIIGHGWHDNTEKVLVPQGIRLHYYTHEHTPMLMTNLLMLLRAGDLGTALHEFDEGVEVQNYHYDTFTDEQRLRAEQLNHVPNTTPVFFAPDGGRLCTDVTNCPQHGPHACDGVFALAANTGLTDVHFLACRVDVTADPRHPPTHELMDESGVPSTALDDQLKTWIRSFLGLTPVEQDTSWENVDYETQVLLADDGELMDWAQCYDARTRLRETDPTQAAALVAGLPEPVRLRLFRDYPDYRHLLTAAVQLSDAEQQWIDQDFLTQDFLMQVGQWQSFPPDQQLRYLADPEVANWAAAYRVWDYYQIGMEAEYLADLIRQLDAANKTRLQTQDDLITHLGPHAAVLN